LTLNADGSFGYTPELDFSGVVTFTYHAHDGLLDSNASTVTVTVNPVNDPPVAVDDPGYTTDEDTTLNVAAPGVLGNDTDVDEDSLTAVLDTGPTSGTLTLNADGSFDYMPDADFSGNDSFSYRANDGTTTSTTAATVTVTVVGCPDHLVFQDTVLTSGDFIAGISITAGPDLRIAGPVRFVAQELSFLDTVEIGNGFAAELAANPCP
jgi:VCBS repeat-containing protein